MARTGKKACIRCLRTNGEQTYLAALEASGRMTMNRRPKK